MTYLLPDLQEDVERLADRLKNGCRADRRPKPPSLAEQALDALRDLDQRYVSSHPAVIVRRALERLQELEQSNE